jgi:hypothetical protein
MGMLDIAVGEDHLVDGLPPADLGQVALVEDRNAVGISRASQRSGIAPIGDPRNLGGREGDN